MTQEAFNPKAFGQRLSDALEERGLTLAKFQTAVEKEANKAKGSSYGTIWSYLHGQVTDPRTNIVEAMATVLGLEYEFLLTGRGPRTPGQKSREAMEKEAHGDEHISEDPWDAQVGAIQAGAKRLQRHWPYRLNYGIEEHLVPLALELLISEEGSLSPKRTLEEVEEVTYLLGCLIELPPLVFGFDALGDGIHHRRVREYYMAMSLALRLVMPGLGRGRPQAVLQVLRQLQPAWEQFVPLTTSDESTQSRRSDDG